MLRKRIVEPLQDPLETHPLSNFLRLFLLT